MLTERIAHWATVTPDELALRFLDTRYTWAQWYERVRRVSGGLTALGVRRGDRVAFLDRNHPACLEVTLGAAAIGAMDTVVNWRLAPDELAYVLADCGARVLFVGADLVPALDVIRDRLPALGPVIVVGGPGDEYEAWLAGSPALGPSSDVVPTDPALLLYTSGTTGYPKGAMLTHGGLVSHSRVLSTAFDLGPGDDNLVAMPLFHVGGTSYALLGIHNGAPTTMTRDPDVASLVAAVAGGVTHAFLVPAVIAGILSAGPPAAALASLRLLGYGASPCPLPVLRRALQAWPDTAFVQVYGATELSGVVTTLGPAAHRDDSRPERLTSAGEVLPGVEMRVVDPGTLEDVEPGTPGELWFRAEQVMAGYWGRAEASAEAITADGWYRTGDIGAQDDGGFVFIVDRVKDLIISGGENVYSPEVERVVAEHPTVAEVAVIGIPDERWGETVTAMVTLVPGGSLSADELIAFCRSRLAGYKCPRRLEILDALPRNATGKILKRDLRKPYWAGRDRAV